MVLLLRFASVKLLAGLWLSLKLTQCQDLPRGVYNTSHCYNTSSGKSCFTTFRANNSHPVRKPFNVAKEWCRAYDPGSSLIIISSLESQRTAQRFIGRLSLANETIFTDARKLSVSENLEWSWVNGQRTLPNVTRPKTGDMRSDGGCVELNPNQQLGYCRDNVDSSRRYVCEYSDSRSDMSHQHNNKSYVVSELADTWYEARNECLRQNGDLASITDLQTIENWSRLKKQGNTRYWIGLHRNKWIWNSSGSALTYSNFEGGYPDESLNEQCVCIYPRCKSVNSGIDCNDDRKWFACNCNHSYAIVCQKEEPSDVVTNKMLSSTFPDAKSSVVLPVHTVSEFHSNYLSSSPASASAVASTTRSTTTTDSTSLMTQKPSDQLFVNATTASVLPSIGTAGILLMLCLPLAVIFIIIAVIVVVRKRKYDRRNEGSLTKQTEQSEPVATVYATVVPGNRPIEGPVVSPNNTIYADVEMIQRPTPTNNAIYASVQPCTGESVHMGGNLVYADLDFQKKAQQ